MSGEQRSGRPSYGVDAPGVIRGLIGGGLAGMAAGWAANRYGGGPFITAPGAIMGIGAIVPVVLGASMIAYAARGKQRLRDWMLDRIAWRGDETVIDVGAGRGLMAVGAAKRMSNGRLIAVDVWRREDLSGNGAAGLIANARAEGVAERIEVRDEDARVINLPDASADVIVSVLCIHNIEPVSERARALDEIVRLLKPGGRVLVADYTATGSYARHFRAAGLEVLGPVSAIGVALTAMTLVDARKPLR
jgi:SAM-dependent methyltransferase